jgi:hypothetical protein
VQWTTRDKSGTQIAGVRPLVELQKTEWRQIDAIAEFPTQGQVFWHNAAGVGEGMLVAFRTEPNPRQRDEFRVVEPKTIHEVFDLRHLGTIESARRALTEGIRTPPAHMPTRVFVLLEPETLVGPVDIVRTAGIVRLSKGNCHRLPIVKGGKCRPIQVDGIERLVRIDESPPTGYVDWDDDAVVLRRAIEAAVRVARESGKESGQTKKQIDEAARVFSARGLGTEAQLDAYRIQRALEMIEKGQVLDSCAQEIAALVLEHPKVQASLDTVTAQIKASAEEVAKAEIEKSLTDERQVLRTLQESINSSRTELERVRADQLAESQRLTSIRVDYAEAASQVELDLQSRVERALSKPYELVGQVAMLRPFMNLLDSAPTASGYTKAAAQMSWSKSKGERVADRAALRRLLSASARTRGVDPGVMIQIHCAAMAQMLVMAAGPRGLGALVAYARATCGGRINVCNIGANVVGPTDFPLSASDLALATEIAEEVGGRSFVVLEGANRGPIEGYLVPLLQAQAAGLPTGWDGTRLVIAATLANGVTAVPVTSEVWNSAIAVIPDFGPSVPYSGPLGDVPFVSDLMSLGDTPKESVAALVDEWPECSDLSPALERYGSALSRFVEDDLQIGKALLHGLAIPHLLTQSANEQQAEIENRLKKKSGDDLPVFHRLRKYLC